MKLFLLSIVVLAATIGLYNISLSTAQKAIFSTAYNILLRHKSFLSSLKPLNPALFATSISPRMTTPRAIKQSFLAIEQSEGVGAKVRRSIGTPKLKNFSPFLMLDHFSVSPGAGFPDHPHRGQETITYLLEGAVDHEDFAGNSGTIYAGDLQFMTAGRGIVHAEMPRQNKDGSANVGMQLWVDLPENLKSCEPRYRDLRASEIPKIEVDDGKVSIKVISGQSHGTDSVKELAYTPVWIFDVTIRPGGKVTQDLPEGWNAFAYTLKGTTQFGPNAGQQSVEQYHNVVFERNGDSIHAEVDPGAEEDGHFSEFPLSHLREHLADRSISTHRWTSTRSRGCSVRALCTQLKRGRVPSYAGLPIKLERLRESKRMAV